MGGPQKRQTSGVKGNFKRTAARPKMVVDPAKFKPSPSSDIQAGQKILHMKFGEGKVISVDGQREKRIATIFFDDLDTEKQKRIMLRFAKLQIIS